MNTERKRDTDPDKGTMAADPEGKDFGTSFGAAHGAIAGGVVGSLAGPGGAVVGAVIGAGAGAAVGYVAGAGANSDEVYWRENLQHQPFFESAYHYDDFATALRLGGEGWHASEGKTFEQSEERLREQWEQAKGNSRLKWEQARSAARAAWERTARERKPLD